MSSSQTSADAERIALRFHDATAAYDSDAVIGSINGTVRFGDSVALIGPNGAGKSTLIKAVLGLVPVVAGSIEVLGTTPARARGRVAYVPQADGLDADFPVSALDVVLMGRYRAAGWLRRPGKVDREIAQEALERLGLADRASDRFGVLSGGQRQRVMLARAVAQRAQLLLLDEPFNGVDTTTTEVVLEVLHELRAEGASVVMATHDLSIAHLACNEACLVNRHQFAFGPITSTLTPELLRKTYGGQAVLLAGDSSIVVSG